MITFAGARGAASTTGTIIGAMIGQRGAAVSSRPAGAGSGARDALERAVADLLAEPLAGAGVDLEELTVRRLGAAHVVIVSVDRDGGVDLDTVTEVTRLASGLLDAADLVPGSYTLEVGSRGVDAPLTAPRHWRRAVGRLVEVHRRSGGPVTGRVVAVGDAAVSLDVAGARGRPPRRTEVGFDDVTRAVVQVEFTRRDDPAHHGRVTPAGSAPGGTGAARAGVGEDSLGEGET